MATIKPLSVSAKRLAATISGSAVAFKLDNILSWDGVTNLVAGDFGTKAYAAFRNSAGTLIEFMEIDPSTIASASITILRRGLKYNGDDLTTEVSANKLTWVKGDTIVELGTHLPQLLAHYVDIVGDQSIAGTKTFSTFPQKSGSTTPTAAAEFATKAYVDATATGTAIYDQNIVTGVAGENLVAGDWIYFKTSDQKWWKTSSAAAATARYVKLAIAQATIATDATGNILIGGLDKTQTGLTAGAAYYLTTGGTISTTPGTFRRFVGWAKTTTTFFFDATNDLDNVKLDGREWYAADSVGTDAYAITLPVAITAYVDGMRVYFKAGTANTGNATLAVNGLTAKNILKNYNTTLVSADIVAGQMVQVAYDSANDVWQMVSPVATASLTSTSLKFGGDGSDGALSVTSGTTTIDLGSAAIVYKNYTSISITGTGALAFSNPHSGGTLVILRSQGDVTITSSATRGIDLRGVGCAAATAPTTWIYDTTATHAGANASAGTGGSAGTRFDTITYTWYYTNTVDKMHRQGMAKFFIPGAGGGNGANSTSSAAGGAGGRGGGALYIECGGAFNFGASATIDISGQAGTAGANDGSGGANASGAGGGAGGNVGHMIILYNSLTANAGTVTASGGAGGNGGSSPGGANAAAGGGGGSSGGGTLSAGAAGGNSANPGGNGGNGGAGIGGGGAAGNGGANAPGGAGGTGGTGGADSTASLITKNLWFT